MPSNKTRTRSPTRSSPKDRAAALKSAAPKHGKHKPATEPLGAFTPWDIAGPCPVPTRDRWLEDADTILPWLRPVADRIARRHQVVLREDLEETAHAALDAADKLIAILDQINGNPDLEDGGDDEPSLGAPENHESNVTWLRGTTRDLELDHQPEMIS